MKNNRALKWLMSLALAVGIAVVGCRKRAEEPTQTVQPPTEVTKQQEEVKQEEAQPTEKPEKKPEEQGSFISRLPEIVETFTSTALQNMGGMGKMVSKESKLTFLEEDAQMVFPKSLGGFEMDYIGVPDSGFTDMKKRPYCISYLSEELMSSICILVEPIPLDPMGNPMDLSACQSRMQKQIEQVSMGMVPMALYDKENEKNYAAANRSQSCIKAYRHVLLRPSAIRVDLACSVTWLANSTRFSMTLRILRRLTFRFWSGLCFNDSCPIIRSRL